MATPRCDHSMPKYASAVSVDSSTPFIGETQLLNGCLALNIQVISTNGAEGTISVDGTNQDAGTLSWVTPTTMSLAANQQQSLVFSLEDNITSMHKFRVRFNATSPGNISIAVNLRHTTR